MSSNAVVLFFVFISLVFVPLLHQKIAKKRNDRRRKDTAVSFPERKLEKRRNDRRRKNTPISFPERRSGLDRRAQTDESAQ